MGYLLYKIYYTFYLAPKLERDEKEKIIFELDMINLSEKKKHSKYDGGVFNGLMRNQMNVLELSRQMKKLAI